MAERYKLKASQVGKPKKPGMQNDGGGLYLSTSRTLSQSWIYRYRKHGKLRDIGLGSTQDVSLAEARVRADQARRAVQEGRDPKAAIRPEADTAVYTFDKAAEEYINSHAPAWKNKKHRQQWTNTLKTYASPKIGSKPVANISTDDVLSVLTPIWYDKTETASRVRMRIENILAWAKAKGLREGFNPAIWSGHLDQLLPPRSKVQRKQHFAALPYAELPELFAKIKKKDSLSSKALQLLILTGCRTSEIIGARWDEIEGDLWTIPESRIKAERTHRVPLSPRAQEIIESMPRQCEWVFPGGGKKPGHLSNMAMAKLLKSLRPDITVHGFRSTFRDWTAEQTDYENHVAEMALAHKVSNQVEAAYRRGDLLEKRRSLMADWAEFVAGAQ